MSVGNDAPVSSLRLVEPYPSAKASKTSLTLQQITKGLPAVLHLFTGWGGCWPCAEQMDRWALEFAERAAFICVGCAGSSLASTFVRDLKLKHTSVTYCAESDMPSWGQLGCGGFIVLDGAGKVAHAKTSAFMQVRDLAFRHVEALVGALCAGAAVPRVAPGVFVVLHGLSSAELNGAKGIVVEKEGPNGRCGVQLLAGGRSLAVKPANLRALDDDGNELDDETDREHEHGHRESTLAEEVEVWQTSGCRPAKSARSGGGCGGGCSNGGGGCGGEADMPARMRAAVEADRAVAVGGGCGDGRCADGPVAPLRPIAATNVQVLDDEHEVCAAALAALAASRSAAALRDVIAAYEAHFAHEEELLDAHLYTGVVAKQAGGGGGGFDADAGARKSHFTDHTRLLDALKAQAARGGETVPAAFVDATLRGFETHANTYDDKYAARLAAAMA